MVTLSRCLLLAGFLLSSTNAIATITRKGAKLFTSDGKQFFNKGVAYQGTPDDPLVNTQQCQLDVALMKTIGVNSIRVYHVDPQQNHDGCMQVLANAGIYVWLDLDTFTTYIIQTNPYWTANQYSHYAAVMDAFIKYDNLAGFWIGNEIINTASGSPAALYIKAAVTDMKAYRDSKGYRQVPIGYSAADIAELRPMLQNYLACSTNDNENIDFFGLNSYEWCGNNNFAQSGYESLQDMAANYSKVIFFSETGCNVGGPRLFQDQAAILGPDMAGTWSGAIIYEWVEETNAYGLVNYGSPGGAVLSGTPTAIAPDFTNLANQWATLTPVGISSTAYSPSLSNPACPTSTPGGWLINGNPAIPTLGIAAVTSIAATTGAVLPTTVVANVVTTTTTGSTATSTKSSSTVQIPSSTVSTAAAVTSSQAAATTLTSIHHLTLTGLLLAALQSFL